jgi:hypothetical protein
VIPLYRGLLILVRISCPAISSNFLIFPRCKRSASLMTPLGEVFRKELPDKKDFWENELKSLGIEPRRKIEFNDNKELQALAEIIKEVYFQDYKTAYSNN